MKFATFLAIVVVFSAIKVKSTEHATLLFVGDISFTGPVRYYVDNHIQTYNESFSDVAPYIREADISVANLESPFVNKDVFRHKYKGYKPVILDADPRSVSSLSFAGFDVVTLANNHLIDFGTSGIEFTKKTLDEAGIKYFGVSYGQFDTSQTPLIMERKGINIGFLAYCNQVSKNKNCTQMRMEFNAGPAVYRNDIVLRDIRALKTKVHVIVVFIHWGEEFIPKPLPYQMETTKYLMSLGAHAVIGAHPHVLQPHCRHENKAAVYSLGNFLFTPGRLPGGNTPSLYGRLGKKPNKKLIGAYEKFVLQNSEALKYSILFRINVTRTGVQSAEYFPTRLAFDKTKRKRLHIKPRKNAKWNLVCEKGDKQCQKCFETEDD